MMWVYSTHTVSEGLAAAAAKGLWDARKTVAIRRPHLQEWFITCPLLHSCAMKTLPLAVSGSQRRLQPASCGDWHS